MGGPGSGRYPAGSGENVSGAKQWSGKINKQYATVISVDKAPLEIQHDLERQMSELEEVTGIVPHRVDCFTLDSSLAYGQTSGNRIGISERATKENIAKCAIINNEQDIKDCEQWVKEAHEEGRFTQERDMQEMLDHYKSKQGYTHTIYAGNGDRNPVIDHEFYHLMSQQIIFGDSKIPGDTKMEARDLRYDKLKGQAANCKNFCKTEKFSHYGGEATSHAMISDEEASAEVYAYWKGGNKIPQNIESVFLQTERGEL